MFEFTVKSKFTFSGVTYNVGDFIKGDAYDAVNADEHYSSGVFVTRINALNPPVSPNSPNSIAPTP